MESAKQNSQRFTFPVSNEIFQAVYDSPASLPGKFKWITPEKDVRKIEEILGMPPNTIGAPLWLSGDRKICSKCRRQISWLDIVNSAVSKTHGKEMIARVILGNTKFVNTEVPDHIKDLTCFNCQNSIIDIRSFKCHNWAYAREAMLKVLQQMSEKIQ
jgi:hypothetical protein